MQQVDKILQDGTAVKRLNPLHSNSPLLLIKEGGGLKGEVKNEHC